MENTQQYTFGAEEKDILLILQSFESELQEKLKDTETSIEQVRYYETFDINDIKFNNIFITAEKDEEGNINYHVYCGDALNEILSIDSEGKVDIKNSALKEYLGDVNLEQLIEENEKNPEKLKGISEKSQPEEMEKTLGVSKNKEDKQEDEEKDEEIQDIETDLKEQGEDLGITKYKKIKDNYINKRMPEVFEEGTENGIAFSNKLNRFVIISKVNGQYLMNENIEPSEMTWKTIISIDPNGEKVERKVPHALMKLSNNDEKEIAITLDQYGYVDIETVDVLPCQERIARSVRTDGEGLEEEESFEIRTEFETEGKEYKHDIAHQVGEIEEAQKEAKQEVDYDITEDDYIPNTEKTWGELMEETGESLPKLIERYNREISKEGATSEKVVETIESDYGNVSHERTRN